MFTLPFILSIITLLLLGVVVYLILDLSRRQQKELSELSQWLGKLTLSGQASGKHDREESMFPLRVQASERLIVLVERIKPGMLVHRHLVHAVSAWQLAQLMLQNIREEFEYNISQQLYVSDRSWQLISAAREEIVQLIHISLASVGNEAGPEALARELFAASLRFPDEALASLRAELKPKP